MKILPKQVPEESIERDLESRSRIFCTVVSVDAALNLCETEINFTNVVLNL